MLMPPLLTDSEAVYLAGLGKSAHVEHRHNLKGELNFLFRVCQQPWVADFIFNPEMNSLPALTAPHNISSAVTCSVLMTNVQCDGFGNDNLFDVHMDGRFIFVPSFSVGTTSVGFGVQECSLLCFTEWCHGPSTEPAHFRYVRDDKESALMIVHESPDGLYLKFELMRHITASKRRRTFAMFDKKQLLKTVRTERGLLHPDSILPSLLVLNSVVEDKGCAKCNAPAGGVCTCQVVLKPPSHPLDFSSLGSNMMTFAGAYEGLSLTSLLEPGKRVHTAKVGTRIHIDGGDDKDLISRLSRWAITDHVRDKKENPFLSILPGENVVQDQEQRKGIDAIDMALIGEDNVQTEKSVEDEWMPEVPYSLFGQRSVQASSDTGILIADSLDDKVDPCGVQTVNPPLESLSSSGSGEVDPDEKVFDLVDSDDKVIDLVDKIAGEALAATKVRNSPKLNSNENGEQSVVESLSSEGSGSATQHGVDLVSNASPATHVTRTDKLSSRAIAIAPSATIDKMGEVDEKERRALLRKRRNREAAARSNLKRKQRNDSLKQALKETHAKAAELRARELVLREENLRLRRLTST